MPQIAFNFPSDQEQPVVAPSQEMEPQGTAGQRGHVEDQTNEAEPAAIDVPAGVGVRLKSLKTDAPASLTGSGNSSPRDPVTGHLAKGDGAEPGHAGEGRTEDAHAGEGQTGGGRTGDGQVVDGQTEGARIVKSKRGRKSLKQGTADADLIEIPDDESLFQKQYYTMGEVADMFRVNQSLLRFWETEFSILQPRKNKKGDRHFRPIDIKNLHLIYHLLRQRKYTIEGAKEFLKKNKKAEERFDAIRRLEQVKSFLLEWKAQL